MYHAASVGEEMSKQNPETTYTNRFRKKLIQKILGIKIYKHSDRFNKGIADLHFTCPGGVQAWIEVKYMKKCAKHRKAGVTDLQQAFLEEHYANGVPAFVLVGVDKKSALYHIGGFDGSVYASDLQPDEGAIYLLRRILEHGT
jgi:hypothetical protein